MQKQRILLIISILLVFICSCTHSDNEENPTPLKKKYLAYILAGQNSGSGIYYHLFDPTVALELHQIYATDSCQIDMNGDGNIDFILRLKGQFHSGGLTCENSVSPLGNNEIAVRPEGSFLADTIRINDTIGNNLSWQTGKCMLNNLFESGTSSSDTGNWYHAGIKYLGVKVHYADTSLYGWIKIHIYNSHFQYIYEYAGTIGY
jgi:hypothetical protein